MNLSYATLKKSVPRAYFTIKPLTSWFYFARDIALISGLFALSTFIDEKTLLWPLYWIAQGTLFFALFLIGHDCGHGSFSRSKIVSAIIGHICMSPLLIPYNSWRISHNAHHVNSGHGTKEDAWRPYTRDQFQKMRAYEWIFRHSIFLLLAMPLYMIFGTSRRRGSHYSPRCSLFRPGERKSVFASSATVMTMLTFLVFLSINFGFNWMLKYYGGAYLVFVMWLSGVTFLHHTDARIPWYTGSKWTFLKGALSTKDRSYGFFDPVIHNIGTHVVHHLFPTIPHYNLKRSSGCILPLIQGHYCKSDDPVVLDFIDTLKQCRFIETDSEGKHFYKSR